MTFSVVPWVRLEKGMGSGWRPLSFERYSLEMWSRSIGKVLNLAWDSTRGQPEIVGFRRGSWEQELLLRYRSLD